MEELDILDSSSASVDVDETSVGSIGSQTLFRDKCACFFENIEQLKEVTTPVQFDEQRQDKDSAVMIVEYNTDVNS